VVVGGHVLRKELSYNQDGFSKNVTTKMSSTSTHAVNGGAALLSYLMCGVMMLLFDGWLNKEDDT
jgi:hypothetical protein